MNSNRECPTPPVASGKSAPCCSIRGRYGEWIDRTGAAASLLCAVHCAAMPLALVSMPLLGAGFLSSFEFECAMFALAAVLGSAGAWMGCRKHGSKAVLVFFAAGLALLLAARLGQYKEIQAAQSAFRLGEGTFLAPVEPVAGALRFLHMASHATITWASGLSIAGGCLIAMSHGLNLYFGSRPGGNADLDTRGCPPQTGMEDCV